MKKRNLLLISTILFCSIFVSCQHDVFLPNPNIIDRNTNDQTMDAEWHAPYKLTSTNGRKRYVELSWLPVKDAIRYNIYRASNPFDTFIQVGETKKSENNYVLKPSAGYDMYYRVSAVNKKGEESELSNIIRATTLTRPIINDIHGEKLAEDSNIIVSWYMNNSDAYENKIFYEVVCMDKDGKEVQVQRAKGTDNSVKFIGLNPNTNYFYQVDVFNGLDEKESSEVVDAATARRLRPDAVTDLTISRGESIESIDVSFILPNYVDVMVEKDIYEAKPLYFKIYRREYVEGNNLNEFQLIEDGFGVTTKEGNDIDYSKVSFTNESPDGYKPGLTVKYTDKDSALERNKKYEYKVQSFAYYDKDISSDYSIAYNHGWLVPTIYFNTDKVVYSFKDKNGKEISEDEFHKLTTEQIDQQGIYKEKVDIKFSLEMEDYGIPYKFTIMEYKSDLKHESKTSKELEFENGMSSFSSINEINGYGPAYILTDDSIDNEGYYEYEIFLYSEKDVLLDSDKAIGETLITKKMDMPTFGDIKVTTGYLDKIKLEWNWNPAYKYTLVYKDEDGKQIQINNEDILKQNPSLIEPGSGEVQSETPKTVVYYDSAKPGTTRNYLLYIHNNGFYIPSVDLQAQVPFETEITTNYSYDKVGITINKGNEEADNFIVSAQFVNPELQSKYPLTMTKDDASLDYNCGIPQPTVKSNQIVIDELMAGKEILINIEEKRPLSITTFKQDKKQETTTSSEQEIINKEINTAFVGQALMTLSASEGSFSDKISLEWNGVIGAEGYVIFRDRFTLSNTSEIISTDKYIVEKNAQGNFEIISDDAEVADGEKLSDYISLSFDSEKNKFTLVDKYRPYNPETDFAVKWRESQGQITWGAPYKYTVLPIVNNIDASKMVKNGDIVTLGNNKFINQKNVLGGTKGYGWNVTSTKGTYSGSNATDQSSFRINNGIKVTWTEPYFGNKDGYFILRRSITDNNDLNWKKLPATVNVNEFVDTNIVQGEVYEYAVVNGKYTSETPDSFFLNTQSKNGQSNDSVGFILPKATISAVSRTDKGIGKEEVTFFAQKIKGFEQNQFFKGYVIQVRNNNIDNKWHDIKTVPITEQNKANNSFTEVVDNSDGLLKVLRDYKHYFRIRLYNDLDDGTRIYSIPDESFQADMNTDYVKWGCRQISNEEFTRAANLLITYGVHYIWAEKNTSSQIEYSRENVNLFTDRIGHFNFKNYQKTIKTKGNINVPFLSVSGMFNGHFVYENNPYSYQASGLTFNCVNESIKGLYNGKIDYYTNGKMKVTYGNETKEYNYKDGAGTYCPLVIGKDVMEVGNVREYLHETEAWQ